MHIFLYEFVTGGGTWGEISEFEETAWLEQNAVSRTNHDRGCSFDHTLLAEGAGMVVSLAEDFLRIPHVEVHVLADSRLPHLWPTGCIRHGVDSSQREHEQFSRVTAACDRTLIIAPEYGGQLLKRLAWAESAGGRLISPGRELVRLASSKHETAEFLASFGIPVPTGIRLRAGEGLPTRFSYPAVLKPDDGVGSMDVRYVRDATDTAAACLLSQSDPARWYRLETYQPGQPASISLLCGPDHRLVLPPCEQHLSADGRFQYQGGRVSCQAPWADRARRLAQQVAAVLPNPIGYLGLDLVMGLDATGRDDRVIEINPRLTTSYLGLRRLAHVNLASAMLTIAAGEAVKLEFDERNLDFQPDDPV